MIGLTAAAMLAGPLAMSSSAMPSTDGTPPRVKVAPGYYPLGSVIDDDLTDYGNGDIEKSADWSIKFDWTDVDPSGICAQSVFEWSYNEGGGDGGSYGVNNNLRSLTFPMTLDDYARGGEAIQVTGKDCAGNKATSNIAYGPGTLTEDDDPALTYAGKWGVSHAAVFNTGSTHFTSAKGASVSETVEGGSVALVMEQSATRGQADVYVDGKIAGHVNTYTQGLTHRQVVWEKVLAPGTHKVKVVNDATPGHPRIDLDLIASYTTPRY